MENVSIREYIESDLPYLREALVKLNDHIAAADPLRRIFTGEGFKELYTANMLELCERQKKKKFICESEGAAAGFTACVIVEYSSFDKLSYFGKIEGRIIEFFVEESHRGTGAAQALLKEAEDFF